jgi:hypothetical protein
MGDHGVGFAGVFPRIDSGLETPLGVFTCGSGGCSEVSGTAAFPWGYPLWLEGVVASVLTSQIGFGWRSKMSG